MKPVNVRAVLQALIVTVIQFYTVTALHQRSCATYQKPEFQFAKALCHPFLESYPQTGFDYMERSS
jgi:hypothetical protein